MNLPEYVTGVDAYKMHDRWFSSVSFDHKNVRHRVSSDDAEYSGAVVKAVQAARSHVEGT